MNRRFVFLFVVMLLLVAAGCAPAAAPAPQASRGGRELAPGVQSAPAQPAESKSFAADGQTGNQPQAANAAGAERMIVYSGQLSLVVKDTLTAVDQITQIVSGAGGFVTASNTFQDAGHTRATMTIRVPGQDLAQLKATLTKIKALALQVESENLNGQDVTDQYADTQAEIENLTAQRDSYRKLLDSATKMEDILNIQTRLDQVQGQINQLTGQQLRLKESIQFATVDITLTPDALAQPIMIGTWQPEGTVRGALQALIWALQRLGDLLIVVGICVLPAAVLIGVPLYLLNRVRLARRRRSKQAIFPPQA